MVIVRVKGPLLETFEFFFCLLKNRDSSVHRQGLMLIENNLFGLFYFETIENSYR